MAAGSDDQFTAQLAAFVAAYNQAHDAIGMTAADDVAYERAVRLLEASEDHVGMSARLRARVAARMWRRGDVSFRELGRRLGLSKSRAEQLVKIAAEESAGRSRDPSLPEPQAVVAAIVTSGQGVLIGRRNDGKPPWGFITGEIEPGESPEDAAIREVKEETGLHVRASRIIGRRVHPDTQRTIVYVTAEPEHGTVIHVGDEAELAEVRWASFEETAELLPRMFPAAKAHLRKTLRSS